MSCPPAYPFKSCNLRFFPTGALGLFVTFITFCGATQLVVVLSSELSTYSVHLRKGLKTMCWFGFMKKEFSYFCYYEGTTVPARRVKLKDRNKERNKVKYSSSDESCPMEIRNKGLSRGCYTSITATTESCLWGLISQIALKFSQRKKLYTGGNATENHVL